MSPHLARRRLVLVLVVLLAQMVGSGPAIAHPGYHYAQQASTSARRGIWWTSEVTNPSVPVFRAGHSSAEHFVAPAWLSDPFTTSDCAGVGVKWLELGWGERGDLVASDGYPYRFVYAFNSYDCSWTLLSGIFLAPGERIEFLMLPTGSNCSGGTDLCIWTMYAKRATAWYVVDTVAMAIGDDAIPTLGMEVQNQNSGSHWDVATGSTGNDVDWFDAYLRHADGLYYQWLPLEAPTYYSFVAPYSLEYYAFWHRFRGVLT